MSKKSVRAKRRDKKNLRTLCEQHGIYKIGYACRKRIKKNNA